MIDKYELCKKILARLNESKEKLEIKLQDLHNTKSIFQEEDILKCLKKISLINLMIYNYEKYLPDDFLQE